MADMFWGMDYRDILKNQLQKRQKMNPRYSLRAFAKKLEISPSKVSEIISGKKRLSAERAEDIAQRLDLRGKEHELFVLSALLEATSNKVNKEDLKTQIRQLATQINAGKTAQRNAWYFGAVSALADQGLDAKQFKNEMGLTDLQIENARRFRNRIRKHYPERLEMSFEPLSLVKKIADEQFSSTDSKLSADFIFLSKDQVQDLERKIKSLLLTAKSKTKTTNPEDLCMVHWGLLTILK
jgi:uncharacterized protein (TIGR02147 family)